MFELPKYTSFRSIASPWLERIPSHWQAVRTKSMLHERSIKGYPDEPLLAATQTHGVIRKSEYGARTVTATKDLHLLKLVEVGDFVISLRSFQGGIERCYHRGIISPAYTVLTANSETYRDYLTHLFKSTPFISSLSLAVTGIREGQTIDYSKLATELLPVPPPDEQAAIVKYLAHANARIDKAIAAKRRLASLVAEQRRRSQRGIVMGEHLLSESRRATSSPWFPEVPSSWDVVKLGRLIHFAIDGPHFSPKYVDDGVPFLSARNIRDDRWLFDDVKYVSESDYEEFNRRVRPRVGDVLYTKGGTTGVARVVDLNFPFQVWVHVAVLRPRTGLVDPHYLALALNSQPCYEQAQLETRGATNQDLGLGRMKRIELSLPPLSVQRELVVQFDRRTRDLNTTSERLMREIDLLREFRTRLVADVVTGQLDVRAVAATLPDLEPGAAITDQMDDASVLDIDGVMETSEV